MTSQDREMTEKNRDTIEARSNLVVHIARELARDIDNFLTPIAQKDGISPSPALNALDQIAENLTQTEIALKNALEAFKQLTLRIR